MVRPILWYFLGRFIGERTTGNAQQPPQQPAQQTTHTKEPESLIESIGGEDPHFEIAPGEPWVIEWDVFDDAAMTLKANVLEGPTVRITIGEQDSNDEFSFTVDKQDPLQERTIRLAGGASYRIRVEATPKGPTNDNSLLYFADETTDP